MQEQELLLVETENSYGAKLLELEQLSLQVSHEKTELEELVQSNAAKEKEIDEMQKEIEKHDTMIDRKRVKFVALNKTVEEVTAFVSQSDDDYRRRCCSYYYYYYYHHYYYRYQRDSTFFHDPYDHPLLPFRCCRTWAARRSVRST